MVRYLRAANVKDGTLDLTDVQSMNFTPAEQSTFALRPGDVLVSEGSGSLSSVGASAVWRGELDGMVCFQNTLLRLRPRVGVDGRYLEWWARSAFGSGVFASIASGANIYHLGAERVRALPISLPPLEEQRRIAGFLDTETARVDILINLRKRQQGLLKERTQQCIADLCTGRNLPQQKDTQNAWIPRIPINWNVLPLKRRWSIIDCKHRTPSYLTEGYAVMSPGDISPGRVDLARANRFVGEEDFADLADQLRRPRRGDIVYSRNASLGTAAYVDTDTPFTMGQDVCKITSATEDQLFLTYTLNTVALNELRAVQIGSTFTRVNIGTLLEISIPCPPAEEQKRIALLMDDAAGKGKDLQRRIDRQIGLLAERRQALITAAVTGQIDVSTASGRGIEE
ncbi:restriction endonuclease subunit S [Streptomyces sp. LBL]|uniref:restriction endonuclease subunit S n=1 Tax=Streptomyces sp. LBL TaxID=2940562 RepID=UPI00247699CF|nr:restriction endonuclease subunit S [Streptomyces sp. LBL]